MVSSNLERIIRMMVLGVLIAVFGSSIVYSASYDDYCDPNAVLYPYICPLIIPESVREAVSSEPGNVSDELEDNSNSDVGSQDNPRSSLSECSVETKLTIPPLNINDYYVIAPLGNLNPPGHTIPTDHIYYYINRNDNGEMVKANIYAPVDIRI